MSGITKDVKVGDMQLNSQQYRALKSTRKDGTFLAGRPGLKYRWDPKEMPVEIADNIYEYNMLLVHKTIQGQS